MALVFGSGNLGPLTPRTTVLKPFGKLSAQRGPGMVLSLLVLAFETWSTYLHLWPNTPEQPHVARHAGTITYLALGGRHRASGTGPALILTDLNGDHARAP
eukprot:10668688-Lingulodinium_polyedra.AAC.1